MNHNQLLSIVLGILFILFLGIITLRVLHLEGQMHKLENAKPLTIIETPTPQSTPSATPAIILKPNVTLRTTTIVPIK